jgi:hypothetical protein
MTEIVYVCSSDRGQQVTYSLTTLLKSGTTFDRVTIYTVGNEKPKWEPTDRRIQIQRVDRLFGDYFHGNKIRLCESSAETVIFLDTDTFILRPIDTVWQEVEGDFIGRVGPWNFQPSWDKQAWQEAFYSINAPVIPMFNAGFLIFRNGIAPKIKAIWSESIKRYLNKEYRFPAPEKYMPEQFGLSLALSANNIKWGQMKRTHHWLGRGDPQYQGGAVVFHTSAVLYQEYLEKLKINFSEDELALRNALNVD